MQQPKFCHFLIAEWLFFLYLFAWTGTLESSWFIAVKVKKRAKVTRNYGGKKLGCVSLPSQVGERWVFPRPRCRQPTPTSRARHRSQPTQPLHPADRRAGDPSPSLPGREGASLTSYLWAEKFESFERINSIPETNGNFDSCISCKRLGTSRLHELHESKSPFVSRIEFIRSKLSNFSAYVYGVSFIVSSHSQRVRYGRYAMCDAVRLPINPVSAALP